MLILLGIDFGDQLKGEWELIAKTPITFIVAVVSMGGVMWTIFHFLFKHRFETAVHAEAMTKDALHSMRTARYK